jgi:hypothetical protein
MWPVLTGARTADIMAALWPERVKSLVSVSGYLIGSQQIGARPLPPQAELSGGISFISPPRAARRAIGRIRAILRS